MSHDCILRKSDFWWEMKPQIKIIWKTSIKMMKNFKKFQKFQLILKIVKHFTRVNHHFPNQIKSYYASGTNISYGDIRKNTDVCFQSASRIQFLDVKKWCSAKVFLTPNRKMLAGKFVKWERILAVLWEHAIFDFKWVEVHKMGETVL